ncbi:phenylalanine--tRNA ligase subunit beta [Suttonella ornithocola]|uniref:Phenylalanine--tRNA ligase beta subunit n=1 Tax=Suttonella ornithocola TaxID=279832 RepID=A0A380MY68_9GAMM|nr:phenylalanine--tRNA ligase subunit beta [Suttonella ornithocola]SUO96387.1 Phenylalanine--tRNA ligase beta subunit [Suttonella ornithocola]
MQLSTAWLAADYGLELSPEALAKRLTMAGLEVDSMAPAAGTFSGVIVGEVTDLMPHPDADKLRIATVNTGKERLQIVCGAPNVAKGVKVPVALIGAQLPGDFKIKKSKLRGVESFGMLCSARELGMSDDHSGLLILPKDAPIGEDIREYLQLNDTLIDIDLTPNRADAFSMRGLAREAAMLFKQPFTPPNIQTANEESAQKISIDNHAPQDCPLYLARVITNIDNTRPTPLWLQERLRRAGVRTHDPIVDVTNYVMMQLGTPLHAFDRDKIGETIVIRRAQKGETLKLINDNTANLDEEVLVIADENHPLAIAGVMGGAESGCSTETHTIVLESAWFNPVTIAGKARRFALSSDSAQRFERGVDYTLQKQAMELATQLIIDICGGQAGSINQAIYENDLPHRETIILKESAIEKRIGRAYPHEQVTETFQALGCEVQETEDGWKVLPPAWRFDMEIPEDLIEEIARVDGYDNIPNHLPITTYQKDSLPPNAEAYYADKLASLGFREVIAYSFIDRNSHSIYFGNTPTVNLHNPISAELAEMRLSLIPGLVNTLLYNRNRQQNDLFLFEIGKIFLSSGKNAADAKQPTRIAGVMSGLSVPEQWTENNRVIDFYDLKGIVETLLDGLEAEYRPSKLSYLHPGQSADIYINNQYIGYLGALHPQTLKQLNTKGGDIWVFEIDPSHLEHTHTPSYQAITRYPTVRRDLALVVDTQINAAELAETLRKNGSDKLHHFYFFDQYQGEHLPKGKKSLAVALFLQDSEKTLQDEEVESIISHLVETLRHEHGAELR